MNGGESDYVGGDFKEDGSFLILELPQSPTGSGRSSESVDPPPYVDIDVTPTSASIDTENTVVNAPNEDMASLSLSASSQVSQTSVMMGTNLVEVVRDSGESQVGTATGGSSEIDPFSMTNYSLQSESSASSTDTQTEDLKKQMDQVLVANASLRDSSAIVTDRLKTVLLDLEEMKSVTSASLEDNKRKCEESRLKIETLEEEKAALINQVKELQAQTPVVNQENLGQSGASTGESDFETLQSMESQLSLKDDAIKQKDEMTEHLDKENKRLKEIIRQNDELLRKKDELLQQRSEFLSKSDGALALSFAEKDELERKIETFEKKFLQFEEDRKAKEQESAESKLKIEAANKYIDKLKCEISELKTISEAFKQDLQHNSVSTSRLSELEAQRLSLLQEIEVWKHSSEVGRQEIDKLKGESNAMSSSIMSYQQALEDTRQQSIVRLAAQQSEHENQLQMFRVNLQEEISEKKRFEIERLGLMEELNRVNALLTAKMDEMNELMKNIAPAGIGSMNATTTNQNNSFSSDSQPGGVAAYPGQVLGFLKREFLGIGTAPSGPRGQSFEVIGSDEMAQSRAETVDGVPDMSCPVCKKQFDSVPRLERHVQSHFMEDASVNSNPFVFP